MLDQLHQSYRDALTMKYLYGMTDAEIAGVMGIKPASVPGGGAPGNEGPEKELPSQRGGKAGMSAPRERTENASKENQSAFSFDDDLKMLAEEFDELSFRRCALEQCAAAGAGL